MRTVAGAEPAAEVTSFANGDTTQMGADTYIESEFAGASQLQLKLTQHDQPLGLLDTNIIGLGVTESSDVDLVGLVDLALGSVSDEDGLATPLDDDLVPVRRRKEMQRAFALTFLPSGMALRSTSTLAMARTSAEADMLVRNSIQQKLASTSTRYPQVQH